MKKQFSLLILSISWILWFVAVFTFPVSLVSTNIDYTHDSISNLEQVAKIQFNAAPELLEIPEFKIDWSLNAKLNPEWYFDFLSPFKVYLASSFFKKSIPLFDVKDTFIHFYYTW
tara:strand:+ start:269 stop:613 length:345 start_codon:yes stop_codon:yes gene_type:complete